MTKEVVMEAVFCANTNCVKHTEHRGGRFRFVGGGWYCEDCAPYQVEGNPGKNLWDFVTTHFDGQKTHVRSRSHLDQLCKQHGVSNFARENNERSW